MSNANNEQTEPVQDNAPPSGVPRPGRLGASKKEAIWLALAVAILLLMGLSFWYEAAH